MAIRGSEKPLLPYKFFRQGAVHKRRRQLGGGRGGVKNWSKLSTDSTKKLPTLEKGAVKNPEKLPTSFMDGLQCAATEN